MPRKESFGAPALAALATLAFAACSGTKPGTLAVTTGGEEDALARAPTPTRLVLEAVALDGTAETLADVPLPGPKTVDVATLPATRIARFRAAAKDAAGATLLAGETLAVEVGVLDGLALPLFLQRRGELARLPSPTADAREAPTVAVSGGRHVVVAGGPGDARDGTLYDMAFLRAYAFPAPLPRAPRSLATVGSDLLVIDDAGASWVALATFESVDASAPAGGAFADVAGGATVVGEDGVSYVVGPTRMGGAATGKVLRVASDGTLAFVTLARPRLGAAAAWVPGRGLAVAGGAAEGPGVEVVGATATAPLALPYPARDAAGAGAAALDGNRVLLAGGRTAAGAPAASVVIDLGCAATCEAAPFGPAAEAGGPLAPASAFLVGPDAVLVVGDAPDGASHAVRVGRTAAAPVPLRVPRRGARGLRGPTGALVVAGGAAELESYLE